MEEYDEPESQVVTSEHFQSPPDNGHHSHNPEFQPQETDRDVYPHYNNDMSPGEADAGQDSQKSVVEETQYNIGEISSQAEELDTNCPKLITRPNLQLQENNFQFRPRPITKTRQLRPGPANLFNSNCDQSKTATPSSKDAATLPQPLVPSTQPNHHPTQNPENNSSRNTVLNPQVSITTTIVQDRGKFPILISRIKVKSDIEQEILFPAESDVSVTPSANARQGSFAEAHLAKPSNYTSEVVCSSEDIRISRRNSNKGPRRALLKSKAFHNRKPFPEVLPEQVSPMGCSNTTRTRARVVGDALGQNPSRHHESPFTTDNLREDTNRIYPQVSIKDRVVRSTEADTVINQTMVVAHQRPNTVPRLDDNNHGHLEDFDTKEQEERSASVTTDDGRLDYNNIPDSAPSYSDDSYIQQHQRTESREPVQQSLPISASHDDVCHQPVENVQQHLYSVSSYVSTSSRPTSRAASETDLSPQPRYHRHGKSMTRPLSATDALSLTEQLPQGAFQKAVLHPHTQSRIMKGLRGSKQSNPTKRMVAIQSITPQRTQFDDKIQALFEDYREFQQDDQQQRQNQKNEIDKLKSMNISATERIGTLEKRGKDLQSECDQKIKSRQNKIEELKNQKTDMKEQLRKFKDHGEKFQDHANELTRALKQSKSEAAGLRFEIGKLKDLGKENTKLLAVNANLEAECKGLEVKCKELTEVEIKNLKSKATQAEVDNKTLHEQLSVVNEKFQHVKKEVERSDERILQLVFTGEKLQIALDDLKIEYGLAIQKSQSQEKVIQEFEKDTQQNKELTQLQTLSEGIATGLNGLGDMIKKINKAIDDGSKKESGYENFLKSKFDEVASSLNTLSTRELALPDTLTKLIEDTCFRHENSTSESEKHSAAMQNFVKQALEDAQTEKQEARQEAVEILFERRIAELKRKEESIVDDKRIQERQLQEITKQFEDQRRNLEECRKQLNEKDDEIAATLALLQEDGQQKAKLDNLESSIDDLNNQLEVANQKILQSKKDLVVSKCQFQEAQAKASKLEEDNKTFEDREKEAKKGVAIVLERANAAQKMKYDGAMKNLQKNLDYANRQLDDTNQELIRCLNLKEDLTHYKSRQNGLSEKVQLLFSNLAKARSDVEAARNEDAQNRARVSHDQKTFEKSLEDNLHKNIAKNTPENVLGPLVNAQVKTPHLWRSSLAAEDAGSISSKYALQTTKPESVIQPRRVAVRNQSRGLSQQTHNLSQMSTPTPTAAKPPLPPLFSPSMTQVSTTNVTSSPLSEVDSAILELAIESRRDNTNNVVASSRRTDAEMGSSSYQYNQIPEIQHDKLQPKSTPSSQNSQPLKSALKKLTEYHPVPVTSSNVEQVPSGMKGRFGVVANMRLEAPEQNLSSIKGAVMGRQTRSNIRLTSTYFDPTEQHSREDARSYMLESGVKENPLSPTMQIHRNKRKGPNQESSKPKKAPRIPGSRKPPRPVIPDSQATQ